jgi:hypothetical protein
MNYPNHYPPNPYQQTPARPYPQVANPKPKISMRERLIVLGISLFFYIIALCTPALIFQGGGDDATWPGFMVMTLGWMGLLVGQFAWLANIPLLIGMILLLCRRWIGTLVCIIIATLLALHSFYLYRQKIPADEASTRYLILDHPGVGFYFWLFSIVALGISAIILRKRERALIQSPQHQQYPQPPFQQL